jgi:broad specificity phosphatase PhoE
MSVKPVLSQPFIIMRSEKGNDPSPIPQKVIQAMQAFAEKNGKSQIQFVVSPEERSEATGKALVAASENASKILFKDEKMRECNLGSCPHRKDRKKTAEYQAYKKADKQAQFSLPPGPGAESKEQLFKRMKSCVEHHLNSTPQHHDTLLVFVAHDKPMNAFFKGLNYHQAFKDGEATSFLKGRAQHGELFTLDKQGETFVALDRLH